MSRGRQLPRLVPVLAANWLLALAAWTSHDALAQVPVDGDGWYTWQVPAIEKAPGWCCFDRDGDTVQTAACDLETDHGYHGDTSASGSAPTQVQIYALLRDNQWHWARALRPDCPVTAGSTITNLGALDVKRSADTAGPLRRIMFEDDSARLRAHAAFALAQAPLPGKSDALIRLGRSDHSPQVRAQAWFWLAQTGAANSEVAIGRAVRGDSDQHVREQAIFALSQLPDGRDVTALIDLLEDRSLANGARQNALMWLARSESSQALAYLERILTSRGQ